MKIQEKRKGFKNDTAKRDSILEAALQVFAQKGFHESTISEIADKANVADATIYEYFDNKENLLYSIPAKKAKEALDLLKIHLEGIKGIANKIRKLIWFSFWFFQNNPAWTSVFFLILQQNKRFALAPAYELTREWANEILKIMKEGQEEGTISKNINIFIARSLLLGTINHLTTRWILTNKPKDLTELTNDTAELIIGAIQNNTNREIYFINNKIHIVSEEVPRFGEGKGLK